MQFARADTAADAVSLALAQTQRHDTPEAEAAAPRFLFTLETSASLADPLPLSSNEAALLIAAGDDTPPALVPLAPPVWAGLALLAGMAMVRSRRRRRYRIAS